MPTPPADDASQNLFIGREAELAAIFDAWKAAQAGKPQFVTLIGDSGFGKTRLIHEFYRRISIAENANPGGGYWPDTLDPDPVSLRMNPHLEGTRDISNMPWLWCGIRWQQPTARNAVAHLPNGLLEANEALRLHKKPLEDYYKKEKVTTEAKNLIMKLALNLGLSLIPGVTALENIPDFVEAINSKRKLSTNNRLDSTINFQSDNENHHLTVGGRLREFLKVFLDNESKGLPKVPVILILDDAQWADEATLAFVRDFFEEAHRCSWRVIVIATCWESKWKGMKKEHKEMSSDSSSKPSDLFVALRQLKRLIAGPKVDSFSWDNSYREISVTRFSEPKLLAPMVKRIFPGLGSKGATFLLSQAHGNPKVLERLLSQMKHQCSLKYWFQNENTDGDLNANGLNALKSLSIDHAEIVEAQLNFLNNQEPEIFEILVLASPQGNEFYGAAVIEICKRLQNQNASFVPSALKKADDEWNLIRLFGSELLFSEFNEPSARKSLKAISESKFPDLQNVLLTVLNEWFDAWAFTDASVARKFLEVLSALLPVNPTVHTAEWNLLVRVMARRCSLLYDQWCYEAALGFAEDLCMRFANPSEFFSKIDPLDQLKLAACLMEGRHFQIVMNLVEARTQSTTEHDLSWAQLEAKSLAELERFDESIAAWEKALASTPRLTDQAPSYQELNAAVRLGLAESLHIKRGWKEALPQCQAALEEITIACQSPKSTSKSHELAGRICMRFALINYDGGELLEAVRKINDAENHFTRSLAQAGPIPSSLFALSNCVATQGLWRMRQIGGLPHDAPDAFNRALQLRIQLEKVIGRTPEMLSQLAAAHSEFGWSLAETGQVDRALIEMQHAVEFREQVKLRVSNDVLAIRNYSITLVRFGDVLSKAEKWELALKRYVQAFGLRTGPVANRVTGYADSVTIETRTANKERVFFKQTMAATDTWSYDAQAKRDIRHLHYAMRKIGETQLRSCRVNEAINSFAIAVRLSQWIRRHCCSTFSIDEIKDVRSLIDLWNRESDPISSYFWQRLSGEERSALMTCKSSEKATVHAQNTVVRVLNKSIFELPILERAQLAHYFPSPRSITLEQHTPKGNILARLNRLILEDTYPRELSKIPLADSTDLRDGYVCLGLMATAHEAAGCFESALRRICEALHLGKKIKAPAETTRQGLKDMEETKARLSKLLGISLGAGESQS